MALRIPHRRLEQLAEAVAHHVGGGDHRSGHPANLVSRADSAPFGSDCPGNFGRCTRTTPARPDALTGLATPVLVLLESALSFNIERMARYCTEHGVELAPHVKTTMSPEIARRQLDAGAWAVTVANPAQAAALTDVGGRSGGGGQRSGRPRRHRRAVDHPPRCRGDGVGRLRRGRRPARAPTGRRLDVLVEMGVDGGRAGCRTLEQASEVAAAAANAERLRLVGVSAFEGVVGGRHARPKRWRRSTTCSAA